MNKIKSTDYKFADGKNITECTVTFIDGHQQVFKTPQAIAEVQAQLKLQAQQFLVEQKI